MCVPAAGPVDTSSNSGNFLESLLNTGDFWSGLVETVGGSFLSGGSMALTVAGTVECATGVLCAIGAGQIAVGTAGTVTGYGIAQSGTDKFGQAFREAQGSGVPKPGPMGLPASGKMNPERIRYTQDSIKRSYKDGQSLDDTIAQLRSGETTADDIPRFGYSSAMERSTPSTIGVCIPSSKQEFRFDM
jgi:hypothetical protein